MTHLVVGTAGHIDHGKSALVQALTGVDPDRLKEEKRRGITIELGFADLALEGERVVSFVDVPGHERFIRHMVAGAAGIDAVVLVVAADQGVQPQTLEHLDICSLLQVPRGLIVLTKCDLVDDELREVVELEVRERVAGTFLADAPLLSVSSRRGDGLEELRGALAGLFEGRAAPRTAGPARLPVDRSFVLKGFGTVVTGTVVSGAFAEADEVEVLPAGHRTRIRGVQVHHEKVAGAAAGGRAAINLQGLDVGQVERGSTICGPGCLPTVRHAHGTLRLLPGAPADLAGGGVARFHQGTCERGVRFRSLGRVGELLWVDLRFDRPTVLVPGDRYVLRRPAPVDTVGGGEVLDVAPPRRRGRGAPVSDLMELCELSPDERTARGLLLRVRRGGAAGRALPELAVEMGLLPAEAERLAERAEAAGELVRAGGHRFDAGVWTDLRERVLAELEGFHEREPLRSGLSREELRSRVALEVPQDAWRALLDRAAGEGELRLMGEHVARSGHEAVLEGDDRKLADEIESRFRQAGLDPPGPDSLGVASDAARVRKILDLLVEGGRLVRIHDGRLFHAEPLDELLHKLREFRKQSETIDVAGFKALAGVTRKNAIPLLEHFDASRVTRRRGNLREILA